MIDSTSYPHLADEIRKVIVDDFSNYLVWCKSISGNVTCSEAYESLRVTHVKEWWGRTLWAHFISPSRSLFFWRLLFYRLPTEDTLVR